MGARYPLPGTETIDAQLNWWGAANGPGPPDGSGSGDGVDGHGQIDFTPFRTSVAGGTPCTPLPPATLTLTPVTATNDVDTQHTVTATVKDVNGTALSGVAQWCPGWEARAVYARFGPGAADTLHRSGIPEGGAAVVRLAVIAAVALVVAALRLGRLRLSGPSGD